MGNIKAGDDLFFTATMAEIFEKQGHLEDALTIYKILSDTSPWDETLKFKIQKLKGMAERSRRKHAGQPPERA